MNVKCLPSKWKWVKDVQRGVRNTFPVKEADEEESLHTEQQLSGDVMCVCVCVMLSPASSIVSRMSTYFIIILIPIEFRFHLHTRVYYMLYVVQLHAKPFWWSVSDVCFAHNCARVRSEMSADDSIRSRSRACVQEMAWDEKCLGQNENEIKWNEQENFVPKINLMPITLKRLEN